MQRVAGELHDRMRRISDPYLRERLADLEDLAGRLLDPPSLGDAPAPPMPPGAILLARRLGPAELLDWHARGSPACDRGGQPRRPRRHPGACPRHPGGRRRARHAGSAEPGDEAVVDADEGQFVLRPEAEVRHAYVRALERATAQHAGWAALRDRPAVTADGHAVRLMLNVGLGLELAQLDATGADGIGLFRTEIAMLARGAVADVAEQAAIYARVLDAAGDRPVLFRTLDLGADKLLPGGGRPRRKTRRWAGASCASASTGPPCCAGSCVHCCWRPAAATCR